MLDVRGATQQARLWLRRIVACVMSPSLSPHSTAGVCITNLNLRRSNRARRRYAIARGVNHFYASVRRTAANVVGMRRI